MASSPYSEPLVPATIVPAGARGGALPVAGRELLAVLLAVVLCDLTLYRGAGFAGAALLFIVAPGLLVLGSPRPQWNVRFWLFGGMLLLLSARLVWQGSGLAMAAGFALVVAAAAVLAGRGPGVPDVLWHAAQTAVTGGVGLFQYAGWAVRPGRRVPPTAWLAVGLPVTALVLFSTLFILANPDVATRVADTLRALWRALWERWEQSGPSALEIGFWGLVAWLTAGLLRPLGVSFADAAAFAAPKPASAPPAATVTATPYTAIRNMLVAVSVLFAVYLVFEFQTLWFREFPEGFYYAGYAHEGAAWLTAALALATVVLSAAFRGRVLDDPRLPQLRRLAWLWSAENLVLALAVYNRLHIYIGFNGMTRMRTVGLFGTSAVVVGFIFVIRKIARRRDFAWLVHRHLWTVAAAAYLFAVTPVDVLVHRYNVRRVLAGDRAPAVQISEHPILAEGVLVLHPLVNCDDEIIREGIRALLADCAAEEETLIARREQQGWTAIQLADRLLLEQLRRVQDDWSAYADPQKRAAALQRFHDYAYQWW